MSATRLAIPRLLAPLQALSTMPVGRHIHLPNRTRHPQTITKLTDGQQLQQLSRFALYRQPVASFTTDTKPKKKT